MFYSLEITLNYRYMYLKKAWYLKTYMETNSSIIFESYIKSKTNGFLVLTRRFPRNAKDMYDATLSYSKVRV